MYSRALSPAFVTHAITSPRKSLRTIVAILKGHWCRLRYGQLVGGDGLRVFGRLHIKGPGRVLLGRNIVIGEGTRTNLWTYSPDATIEIGDGCFLNGTRISSAVRVSIGAQCILGDAGIIDTNFHSTAINRHHPSAPVRVEPIIIDENVWIAARAWVLPGTHIGENSVIGVLSVCSGEYPANALIAVRRTEVVKPLV